MASAVAFADWAPAMHADVPAFAGCGAWQHEQLWACQQQQQQVPAWPCAYDADALAQESHARLQKLMHNVAHLHSVLVQLRAENTAQAAAALTSAGCWADNFSPAGGDADMADCWAAGGSDEDEDDCCSTCGGCFDGDDEACDAAAPSSCAAPVVARAAAGGSASSKAARAQKQQPAASSGSSAANSAASQLTHQDSDITDMLECALAVAVHKHAAAGGCWQPEDGADSASQQQQQQQQQQATCSAASSAAAVQIEAAMLLELEQCLLHGAL